jgi:hypothetical protein
MRELTTFLLLLAVLLTGCWKKEAVEAVAGCHTIDLRVAAIVSVATITTDGEAVGVVIGAAADPEAATVAIPFTYNDACIV